VVAKLLHEVPEMKREGMAVGVVRTIAIPAHAPANASMRFPLHPLWCCQMTTLGMQLLAYDPHTSNHAPMSVLQQEVFLRAVAAALGVNVDAEDEGEGEGKGEREGEGEGDGNEEPPVAATAALTVADPVQALHALRQARTCGFFQCSARGRTFLHAGVLRVRSVAAVCEPGRMVVQVVGDILAMPSPRKPWLDVFRDLQLTVRPRTLSVHAANEAHTWRHVRHRLHGQGLQRWAPAKRDPATMMSHAHLSELGKQPGNQVHVVTLPTIESSFAIHVARGNIERERGMGRAR